MKVRTINRTRQQKDLIREEEALKQKGKEIQNFIESKKRSKIRKLKKRGKILDSNKNAKKIKPIIERSIGTLADIWPSF